LVYKFDGKIHRPRELLLVWGTLVLSCVLNSVSYRYTLFKPDGTPLRAIASCSFCEHVPREQAKRQENAMSPDLTHMRDIRDGDTLPALAHEVYGKPELYLEVARVNKLVNFRRLRSASRIAFPPLRSPT
ncbi:MAG: LysM peptidoglycan-binding domain-containing protein, partial [Gammaproteobacteria bacterium]|nr:LysM peptidoglycan-binding domain-containing protein [Gammaproteobacteria bacterium]